MNILSMLARLEGALGGSIMTKKMVLLPQFRPVDFTSQKEINLVVGYNGSPRSQSALDLTLWLAHQFRLVTSRQVTVQVVYVVNLADECSHVESFHHQASLRSNRSKPVQALPTKVLVQAGRQIVPSTRRGAGAIAELPECPDCAPRSLQACQTDRFEQADYILWQARNLAEEWRGSLKTHLRFGQVAEELRHVVVAESAALLILGCESIEHPLVQQLGRRFPCSVLGIPPVLSASGVG